MPNFREPSPIDLDTKVSKYGNNYPRLLNLDVEVSDALKIYLDQEISQHESERGPWLQDIIGWQRDYWAKPLPNEEANKRGYATLVIPVSAIAVEAVHARHYTQLFGNKQLVSVRAKSNQYDNAAQPFEQFLESELKHSAKFKENFESCALEFTKLGTGVARAEWQEEVKYGITRVGDREEEFPVYTKRGPGIFTVPISRFVMPLNELDAQIARWCGEMQIFSQIALYNAEVGGLFYQGTYEKICTFLSTTGEFDPFLTSQQDVENRKPAFPDDLGIYCLWLAYDVGMTGRPYEIQVYYHWKSRTICAARYNWNKDLRRPYRMRPYFKVENRWTGIGICKMNEQFQAEITTQHRQRIDNATLANMRMMKISRLSGYGPNEPVFPGKIWYLNDMAHVEPIQMGELYPSSYNNENSTLLYSQQRTGVNEINLGMPSIGTPGTATGDLARVQEGKRRFDYSYGNLKALVTDLTHDVTRLIHQYGPSQMSYFDKVDGGQEVLNLLLNSTSEDLTAGLLIEIVTAGEQDNDIVLRQNWTQIAGLLVQYYTSMLQLAMQTGNQQLAAMITQRAMSSATEAMKQILESYDIRNVDRMIIQELLNNGTVNTNAIPNGQGSPTGVNPLALLQGLAGGNGASPPNLSLPLGAIR
jgi:hypothetical protein